MSKEYIYKMFNVENKVIYVGQTKNYFKRFKGHACRNYWWDKVDKILIAEVPENDIPAYVYERAYIWAHDPKYNRAKYRFDRQKYQPNHLDFNINYHEELKRKEELEKPKYHKILKDEKITKSIVMNKNIKAVLKHMTYKKRNITQSRIVENALIEYIGRETIEKILKKDYKNINNYISYIDQDIENKKTVTFSISKKIDEVLGYYKAIRDIQQSKLINKTLIDYLGKDTVQQIIIELKEFGRL